MIVKIDTKRNISIIQDASYFTFSDNFKGLFAVAVRDIPFGFTHKGKTRFKLYYGNSSNYYPVDDRNDLEYAKTEIINAENQYVSTEVLFDEERVNCNMKFYQQMKVFTHEDDKEL